VGKGVEVGTGVCEGLGGAVGGLLGMYWDILSLDICFANSSLTLASTVASIATSMATRASTVALMFDASGSLLPHAAIDIKVVTKKAKGNNFIII